MAWYTVGIYHSATSAFWNLIITRASNNLVIYRLECHLYLQYPLSCKGFDPWDVGHLLSLLELGLQPLLLLILNLL